MTFILWLKFVSTVCGVFLLPLVLFDIYLGIALQRQLTRAINSIAHEFTAIRRRIEQLESKVEEKY